MCVVLYVCGGVCANVCKCVSDPDAMVMLPVALTGVSAPLIKETMCWQVASLPTLVIGPFLPTLSPYKITHLCLFFSFLCLVPSSYLSSQKRASGQAEMQDFVK